MDKTPEQIAALLHLALCEIASADPGPKSEQSLAHDMARVARQAIERRNAILQAQENTNALPD